MGDGRSDSVVEAVFDGGLDAAVDAGGVCAGGFDAVVDAGGVCAATSDAGAGREAASRSIACRSLPTTLIACVSSARSSRRRLALIPALNRYRPPLPADKMDDRAP